MARAGMSHLITQVRAGASLGTADYSIAGVTYWTDDQIQTELDRTQRVFKNKIVEGLVEVTTGGTAQYFDYPLPYNAVEGTATNWTLLATDGGTAPGYTVDFYARLITFSADTEGSAYMLSGATYNVNAAISNIWAMKAAQLAAGGFDWSSDNHSVKASQQIKNYNDMAQYYRNNAGAMFSKRVRVDENIW